MKIKYVAPHPYILKTRNEKEIIRKDDELDLPDDLANYLLNLPKPYFILPTSENVKREEFELLKKVLKWKFKVDIDKLIREFKFKGE